MILPLGEVLSLIRKGGVLPQGLHLAQVFNLIQGSFGFELLSFRSWLEKMHNAAEGKEANFAGSVRVVNLTFYYSSLFQRFLLCAWAAWCLTGPRSVRVPAAPLQPDHPHLN